MKLGTCSERGAQSVHDADDHADHQHERDGREHPALVVADVVARDDDLGRDDRPHREVELAGDDHVVLAHRSDRDRGGAADEADQLRRLPEGGVDPDDGDEECGEQDEHRPTRRQRAAEDAAAGASPR